MATDPGQDSERELSKAIRTTYNILAYADNTEAALRRKLAERGFSGDIIDSAVEEARASGTLNEARMLESRLHSLINVKKYGRKRIAAELRKLGFPREAIDSIDWDEYDFTAHCAALIRKNGGLDNRLFAALMRRGFLPGEIKNAAVLAEKELSEI
jgi:Uncharacterized protein conserved in bacteria